MKEERTVLKQLIMEKRKVETLVDSDSEVEVIAAPSQPKRQHVEDATFTPTHPSSCLSLSPNPTPHHQGYEYLALLSPSPSPSPFSLLSFFSTPSYITMPSPPPLCPSWPIGCYAIDMINGFVCVNNLMKMTKDRNKNVLMDHVKTVFGVTVPYSTY